MSASAFLVPSCCISIVYEHLCEQFLFTPVSLTLEWCMMNKVSKHYFLYTLFLLAKQQVARPEPNVLFFLPNILFCNSYHFALAIILPKCTYIVAFSKRVLSGLTYTISSWTSNSYIQWNLSKAGGHHRDHLCMSAVAYFGGFQYIGLV